MSRLIEEWSSRTLSGKTTCLCTQKRQMCIFFAPTLPKMYNSYLTSKKIARSITSWTAIGTPDIFPQRLLELKPVNVSKKYAYQLVCIFWKTMNKPLLFPASNGLRNTHYIKYATGSNDVLFAVLFSVQVYVCHTTAMPDRLLNHFQTICRLQSILRRSAVL